MFGDEFNDDEGLFKGLWGGLVWVLVILILNFLFFGGLILGTLWGLNHYGVI